jgi:hypothetical protein
MSLFVKQDVYCSNCGKGFEGSIISKGNIVCSSECREELERKYACYIVGKKYSKEEYLKRQAKKN